MNVGSVTEHQPPPKPDRDSLSEENKFAREEGLKRLFYTIFHWMIIILSVVAAFVFVFRASHLVLPAHYQWLTREQLQAIDNIFYSGAIGGILGGYLRDKMQKF